MANGHRENRDADRRKGEKVMPMGRLDFSEFHSKQVQVDFDEGRFPRARVGVVLLAMEQITDSECVRIIPPGVGIHFTRVRMPSAVTVENLKAAGELLPEAVSLLVPDLHLDAIGYGCTSGSICITEEYAKSQLLTRGNVEKATTMVTGVIHALRAFRARRIAIATPYLDEVNDEEARYLEKQGFEIVSMRGMNLVEDFDIARVRPSFIRDFAAEVDCPEADAVFISCGALRSAEIVDELEQRLGKPVVASNQAFIWDLLRLAGIDDKISGYGQLLRM